MAEIFYVDFKNKKLISKKNIEDEQPDQMTLEKYSYFCELIEEGMTMVRVNTKFPGVQIPSFLEKDLVAAVNWSHKFGIQDFEYDENGVRGTLSFNSRPEYTNLPWDSVWSISFPNGTKCKEWQDSLPKEIYFNDNNDDEPPPTAA